MSMAVSPLGNLAWGNYANKITIAAAGAIPIIIAAMQKHANDVGVNQYGCHALGNLACNAALYPLPDTTLPGHNCSRNPNPKTPRILTLTLTLILI